MGNMIIKKEDIKQDIEICFNNNTIYAGDDFQKAFFNFTDGKLEISLEGCTIIKSDILESYKLKKEYLDKFING